MVELVERKVGDLTIRCAFKAPEQVERDRLIEACALCPVDALIVLDANGNQLVP